MIKGVGVDIVEISRIEHSLTVPGFLTATFTKKEIENQHGDMVEYYATRFACKEAVFKAVSNLIDLRKVETLNLESGEPIVTLTNELKSAGINKVHISISTEAGLAIAYCILE